MLIWCDSFDHWASTDVLQKYTSSRNGASSQTLTTGRFGNGWFGNERWTHKALGASYGPKIIVGFAWRKTQTSFGSDAIFNLFDAGSIQVNIRINDTANEIAVWRANTTQLGAATLVTVVNQFYFIELEVTIGNTGDIVLRVDEVESINETGVDTQTTANASIDGFRLGSAGDTAHLTATDDLYLLDGVDSGVAGAPNNAFLGDVRVEAIFPNGNGNSSQLVGSDADSTDNYLLVDEAAPDDDTTWVQSATVGQKDTYAMGDLTPSTGAVFGMQINPHARKTDAGARSICSVTRLSGVEEDSADKVLSTSYQYLPDIREADPSGNQWTIANVNAMEAGVKVTA